MGMVNDPTIGISLLVQWYELKILNEYIHSLWNAIENYKGRIVLDFCLNINQDLEQIANGDINECLEEYESIVQNLYGRENSEYQLRLNKHSPIGIGEFRRESNIRLANKCDVIVWGETDALFPLQGFKCIETLWKLNNDNFDKWTAFFGTNKMWDKTWECIEHKNFRDKPFDPESRENVWDLCHVVTESEMNEINNGQIIDIDRVWPPQFNGCQLILTSEIIKSGINIPKSMFFMREDTALMQILRKHPEIPQFLFSNIYGPHNRKHPLKRYNIKGEEHISEKWKIGKLRQCQNWYNRAEYAMNQNLANLGNPNIKPLDWEYILNG